MKLSRTIDCHERRLAASGACGDRQSPLGAAATDQFGCSGIAFVPGIACVRHPTPRRRLLRLRARQRLRLAEAAAGRVQGCGDRSVSYAPTSDKETKS